MGAESKYYEMVITRLTVDKLGVKLYDSVSAVVAELIANSYDADARNVRVSLPLNTEITGRRSSREYAPEPPGARRSLPTFR